MASRRRTVFSLRAAWAIPACAILTLALGTWGWVDHEQSLSDALYRAAADLGDAAAMYNVARCYETGRGVTVNEREASAWYRKAADAGDATAMRMLATRLRDAAQSRCSLYRFTIRCEVAEGDDTDEPLVAVENREPSHLQVAHVLQNALDFFVVKAVFNLCAHDVAHLGIRSFAQRHAADHDIAIGDHTDQTVVIAYGHCSCV